MNKGKLYICPTPIGNLEDITLRVLRVLREVDYIAAEDTRHTLKLLNHYEIQKSLVSYHEHNKLKKETQLISDLLEGKEIALVSDAGMPGISDPGQELIQACLEQEIPLEVLPGATAGILALVASGLDNSRYSFEGFLNRDKKKRRERLEKILQEDRTLVFYEAPHRIIQTLKDCLQILGNRRAVVARELTKKYEAFLRGTLSELIEIFEATPPKGEIVLLIEGISAQALEEIQRQRFEDQSIRAHLLEVMNTGVEKKEAIKRVAKARNISKREVYQEAIGLEEQQ